MGAKEKLDQAEIADTPKTRYEFAEQYGCVCIVVNENDTADTVINDALENEAEYFEGDESVLCVRFPDRPQEVYTQDAIKRTFEQKVMKQILNAILELDNAIYNSTKDKEDQDARLYGSIAKHAVGITTYIRHSREELIPSVESAIKLQKDIHKAFGAPGDFGYGTPVGKALQRLYSVKLNRK